MKKELTQQQVQEIDSRLKQNGIKYWDIRMELLDHVASFIEDRLNKGENLSSATESAFHTLGLSGNLKSFTTNRLREINKIVKKQYFRKIKEVVVTPKYAIPLLLFVGAYFLAFLYANLWTFKVITLSVLLIPVVLGVLNYFLEFARSKRSGYLLYTSFYVFFSFLLLNGVIQFVRPEGIIPTSKETTQLVWLVATSINSICVFAGILVHLKTSRKIKMIKARLSSL